MRLSLFFLFLVASISTSAQKALDEMIETEKNFAAYAVANGTKDAFLKYMDTAAVMFEKGEPVKAYPLWSKKDKRAGILNWRPRYAEIAASGDFGYTAGPWTFQPQTINDSVAASGYFFTVWQKNKAGDWKFILDVGTDAGPIMKERDVIRLTKETGKGTEHTLRAAEEAFIRQYKTDEQKAAADFMSEGVILGAENVTLKTGFATPMHGNTLSPGKFDFVLQGTGISPTGDLGYAYGSATANGKKETYLRIWRHELTGWKIALQMVRH